MTDQLTRRPVPADVCARAGCTHDSGSHIDGTGPCGYCPCTKFIDPAGVGLMER